MNYKLLYCLFFLFFSKAIIADPPEPESGKRWVINALYSDEFNGNSLDTKKWRKTYKGWLGRPPAKFVPETVSVKNGYMQIKNGILKKRKKHSKEKGYSIKGGAVQSINRNAHFGYYECRFKASRIPMSTTFWMSCGRTPVNFPTRKSNGEDCPRDSFSQELDICESIGGEISNGDKFRKRMNFNTHYRYVNCNGGKEKFYSRGNNAIEGSNTKANATLPSESWEDFHIYAAHWKNANQVDFYANNKFVGNVNISTEVVDKPFPKPMGINMVTETYNWANPYPTNKQLKDKKINTSYYDWVRSYVLVDVNKVLPPSSYSPIFKESFSFFKKPSFNKNKTELTIPYIYKANLDRKVEIEIVDSNNKSITKGDFPLYAGYGKDTKTISIGNAIKKRTKILVKMKAVDSDLVLKLLVVE